ncbi:MAG: transcriptional regulator, partial [Variovorax sp.]|nr:transcriptional regulator [Variovorax sp.]
MTSACDMLAAPLSEGASRCFGEFEIDTSAAILRRGGVEVRLRRQTWQLLCLLVANPGRLCSKAELFSALWPNSVVVEDSLVQCVGELRKALGDVDRSMVRTVARLGYRFEAPMLTMRHRPPPTAHAGSTAALLAPSWQSLVAANNATQVDSARRQFEAHVPDAALRAEAMAGVAMSYVIGVLNRWVRRPAWNVALAREAAEEAVALNSGSALACHARAHVALIEGRHVEAYLGFRAALWRDPALVRARLRMGVIEMELGHPERTA